MTEEEIKKEIKSLMFSMKDDIHELFMVVKAFFSISIMYLLVKLLEEIPVLFELFFNQS